MLLAIYSVGVLSTAFMYALLLGVDNRYGEIVLSAAFLLGLVWPVTLPAIVCISSKRGPLLPL